MKSGEHIVMGIMKPVSQNDHAKNHCRMLGNPQRHDRLKDLG
ncbi:MAG: hypothetical protein ABSG74_02175 [Candidatus Bathyarchaeia archaeon]|jgi:hypothetical protein